MVTWMVLRGFINLSDITLGWLSPFDGPNHQVSAWYCLVPLPFLSRAGLLLLLALGLSISANKLSLLLFSDFASSMATLAYKALLLSWVFLPFMSPALFRSSYNCWCCATNIESYSSCEYFLNSIFPLKVSQFVLVFCLLAGLVWVMDATLTLGAGAFLSIYWEKILLISVWVCPHYGNCCGHLVTPDPI